MKEIDEGTNVKCKGMTISGVVERRLISQSAKNSPLFCRERYLMNSIRDEFGFDKVPIKLIFRKKR